MGAVRVIEGRLKAMRLPPKVALVFHALTYALYCAAWGWHLSPAATKLPGHSGFGWFFRYLTFCGFTLQLIQLLICTASHFARRGHWLKRASDDLSSAIFALAITITILYHVIKYSGQKVVEGGKVERPPWLDFTVHVGNSVIACVDLILCKRSFSKLAEKLCLAIAASYLLWIMVVKEVTGIYPYPFLNKLPQPWGFVAFIIGSLLVFFGIFHGGRTVSRALRRKAKA
mmetsp:Transcript_14494/g.46086  ORF Transcript_14494/g.46086 Transcript_14494/m.46086 type:complete len:229 (+) Transcript_14494:60-746(+)